MKVVDLLADRKYVLESERNLDPTEQTVFWIRGLRYDLYMKIQSEISPVIKMPGKALGKGQANMDDSTIELQPGARQRLEFEILSEGLVRVEGLKGPGGEEIKYPGPQAPDTVRKDWFARWLPPAVRTELANAITEGSSVDEDVAKN